MGSLWSGYVKDVQSSSGSYQVNERIGEWQELPLTGTIV